MGQGSQNECQKGGRSRQNRSDDHGSEKIIGKALQNLASQCFHGEFGEETAVPQEIARFDGHSWDQRRGAEIADIQGNQAVQPQPCGDKYDHHAVRGDERQRAEKDTEENGEGHLLLPRFFRGERLQGAQRIQEIDLQFLVPRDPEQGPVRQGDEVADDQPRVRSGDAQIVHPGAKMGRLEHFPVVPHGNIDRLQGQACPYAPDENFHFKIVPVSPAPDPAQRFNRIYPESALAVGHAGSR